MKRADRASRVMRVQAIAQRRIQKQTEKIDDLGLEVWYRVYAPAVYREARRVKRMRSALSVEVGRRQRAGLHRARMIRVED